MYGISFQMLKKDIAIWPENAEKPYRFVKKVLNFTQRDYVDTLCMMMMRQK